MISPLLQLNPVCACCVTIFLICRILNLVLTRRYSCGFLFGMFELLTQIQTELEKKLARRKILNNEAPDNEVMHHELIPQVGLFVQLTSKLTNRLQAEDTSSTFSSSQSNTMTVCASAPYSQLASAVPPTAPTPSSPNASRMRSASVMIRKKQEGTISTNIRHRLSLGELEVRGDDDYLKRHLTLHHELTASYAMYYLWFIFIIPRCSVQARYTVVCWFVCLCVPAISALRLQCDCC